MPPTPARGLPVARAPRPDARLNLLGALAVATVAVGTAVGALSLEVLPPDGFSVVLFAAAPVLAGVALPVLWLRARAERDHALGWFASGLLGSLVAAVLQLLSFPAVAPDGGPLGTSQRGNGQLYLLFHLALALGAIAAATGVPGRAKRPFGAAVVALALACAADLVPSPELLTPRGGFTSALTVLQFAAAVLGAVATVLWLRRVGITTRPLRAWAGVALSLSCYDLLLNGLAGERFGPVWWASLSLRLATYATLAAGSLAAVLAELRTLEGYTRRELDRSDSELARSLTLTNRLLASAESLTSAVTAVQVGRAVVRSCRTLTGLPRAAVLVLDEETGHLRSVATEGHDPASQAFLADVAPEAGLPGTTVLRTGRPVFVGSAADLDERFPDARRAPDHARTGCLAALPVLVAGDPVGLLVVSGPHEREWSALEREALAAVAAQAGQALQRALLYERQKSAAELLQRGLLPRRLPAVPGLSMAARYAPGAEGLRVGGDWYDCIPVDGGRLALVVGDVMGKGLQAATRMAQVRNAVRVLAALDPAPAAVVAGLDLLAGDLDEDELVTLVYVLLDPATGSARIARVGHLPPLLVPPVGPPRTLEAGSSPPLGAPRPVRTEAEVDVPLGATLVLYTDGLVEDRRTGLDVGLPELVAASRTLADEYPDVQDYADALLLTGSREAIRSDDTCLLVVRRHDEHETPDVADGLLVSVVLTPDPVSATVGRRFVEEALEARAAELDGDRLDSVVLLCSEVVTNAVVHAGGPSTLRLRLVGTTVRLEMRDCSARLPQRRAHDVGATGGRGMELVDALADDWGVETHGPDGGKTVWFELDLAPGAQGPPAGADAGPGGVPAQAGSGPDASRRTTSASQGRSGSAGSASGSRAASG